MLIVEDGSQPQGANAYISLADADAYSMPRFLWAATPVLDDGSPDPAIVAKKEGAIIRATDYLNTLIWKGDKVDNARIMAFPRDGIDRLENDTVPQAVALACAEVAVLYYGEIDIMAVKEKGVISKSDTTDILVESRTYDSNAPSEEYYQSIAGLLREWLVVVPGEKKRSFSMGVVGRG